MRWRDLIYGIDYGNNGPSADDLEKSQNNATHLVEGVVVKFGRPAAELDKKLKQNINAHADMGSREELLQYIQQRGPIDVYVNSDGSLQLYNDGNTRLYAASWFGISPEEIPVRYYTNGQPSMLGTLSDALFEAKKYNAYLH